MSSWAWHHKGKLDELDFIKNQSFCYAKDTAGKWKDNLKTGENNFQITYLVKDLHWEHRKKLNNKKTSSTIRKWVKDLKRHFTKEDIWMTNMHVERCSASLDTREMHIKTTTRYHYTPIRISKIENTDKWSMASMLSDWNSSTLLEGIQNGTATPGNSLAALKNKVKYVLTIWPTYSTLGHFSKRN